MITTYNMSHLICYMSCVTCHVSCVPCHLSYVMCPMSCFFVVAFFGPTWCSLMVEGLLSTGPYPSSLTPVSLQDWRDWMDCKASFNTLRCPKISPNLNVYAIYLFIEVNIRFGDKCMLQKKYSITELHE